MATLRPVRQAALVAGLVAIAGLFVLPDRTPGEADAPLIGVYGTDDQCFSEQDVLDKTVPLPDPNASYQEIYARYEPPLTTAQARLLESKLSPNARIGDVIPGLGRRILIQNPKFADVLYILHMHELSPKCMQPKPPAPDPRAFLDEFEKIPEYDEDQQQGPVYIKFDALTSVARQREILDELCAIGYETSLPYNDTWRVFIPRGKAESLKSNFDIEWVRPLELRMVDDADEGRRLLKLPGNYSNVGSGSVIGQWEVCHPAIASPGIHADLLGRATVGLGAGQCLDSASASQGAANRHATQVAGIAVGNGAMSTTDGGVTSQWQGVAPGAKLASYSVLDEYDFGHEYLDAVARGVNISTNSFGPSGGDYYYEALVDPYPYRSSFYDTLASSRNAGGWGAGPGSSVLVVASAGNNGAETIPNTNERLYWGTVRIRNSAKNVLTVGNVSTGPDEGRPAFDTGRGPTRDGRIKPDLVAPGAEEVEQQTTAAVSVQGQGIHSPSYPAVNSPNQKYYASGWGTSFSTPFVAGSAALVSSTFEQGACARKPSSAELRALLINSASDLVDARTDAQTGSARTQRLAIAESHRATGDDELPALRERYRPSGES